MFNKNPIINSTSGAAGKPRTRSVSRMTDNRDRYRGSSTSATRRGRPQESWTTDRNQSRDDRGRPVTTDRSNTDFRTNKSDNEMDNSDSDIDTEKPNSDTEHQENDITNESTRGTGETHDPNVIINQQNTMPPTGAMQRHQLSAGDGIHVTTTNMNDTEKDLET